MKKRPFHRQPSQPGAGRRDQAGKPGRPAAGGERGWDPVAAWYDKLVGETGSDYHRHVILPAALELLGVEAAESVVDLCCGQGVLMRPLLERGIGRYVGVDASPRLIDAAAGRHGSDARVSWVVADVCKAGSWADGRFDAAACLMALHDVADLDGLCASLAASLRPGGRAVLVFMHPCFRIPKHSHWGFDNDQKIQFRRLDGYGRDRTIEVATHPGRPGSGATLFYHRPMGVVLSALGRAGLAVVAAEELYSHRRSQAAGPFSKAEHRAAEEFPLFLALKAVRLPVPAGSSPAAAVVRGGGE